MSESNANPPTPVGSTGLVGIEQCGLHKRTPYGMTNVSHTQLSIARYYGGIKYNGESYTYLPATDELIRNDVLKWQKKNRKRQMPTDQGQARREATLPAPPCSHFNDQPQDNE